jgi:hypothetical protein
MIAMLLIAQLGAVQIAPPPAARVTPPIDTVVAQDEIIRVIRSAPVKGCAVAGRMEVSFAQPAALYRRGDRPPKLYVNWNDYPEGRFCHLGIGQ